MQEALHSLSGAGRWLGPEPSLAAPALQAASNTLPVLFLADIVDQVGRVMEQPRSRGQVQFGLPSAAGTKLHSQSHPLAFSSAVAVSKDAELW